MNLTDRVSATELADDPHAKAMGLLVDSVHPIAGRIRQPRHPILFEATPAGLGAPAPALGAHTDLAWIAMLTIGLPGARRPAAAPRRQRAPLTATTAGGR